MQPARIKPHAKEHTNNPVQKPNFRGHAAGDVEVTRACGKAPRPSKDDSRESLDDACHPPQARRATGSSEAPEGPLRRAPALQAENRANDMGRYEDDVVWVSLGGSLFSDWTQPITGVVNGRSHSGQRYRRKEAAVSAFRFAHLWRSFRLCSLAHFTSRHV